MATIVLFWLPMFYMAAFFTALVMAVRTDLWRCATFLTLLYFIGWVPEIWFNPPIHMVANLAIFILITLTYTTKLGWWMAVITCMMMLTNGWFALTEQSEFYRLSIINLLFLAQCLFVIRFSYNSHKNRKRGSDSDKGLHMAVAAAKPGPIP